MGCLVGIDIGGTFTDVVTFDLETGELRHSKRPSIPGDLIRGVRESLQAEDVAVADIDAIRHGTTVVINAILTRSGAKTALVTTEGFRDVLEIGRSNWPEPYNLQYDRMPPLVPRELRLEAVERLGASGEVVTALREDQLSALADRIRDEGVEAVAVCLLHSYVDPRHETEVATFLSEALPDTYVSVSHELSREFREYERTSTVVINAYVGPIVDRYLEQLEGFLVQDRFRGSLYLMESSGGVTSVADAKVRPAALVESGPAAGAIGVARLSEPLGLSKAIAFDMGGTTAKACLVEDGEPLLTSEYYVPSYKTGYPLRVAAVDIVEVGTGGGSIASIDEVGALTVGPRSAQAVPGPACYGNGGTEPTVTDANLILGRMEPNVVFGGIRTLKVDLAEAAFAELEQATGMGTHELAAGILRIADFNMAAAIRAVSLDRGRDPREFTMFAYGGAGALHATSLARELSIPTVIIPPMPGNFSAYGMLLADLRHDFGMTVMAPLEAEAIPDLEAGFEQLDAQASAWRERVAEDMVSTRTLRYVDCRYVGQEHTLGVSAQTDPGEDFLTTLRGRFEDAYQRRYGQSFAELAVEVVSARAVTYVDLPKPPAGMAPEPADGPTVRRRDVYFDGSGFLPTEIYRRENLAAGTEITGPAIIEEYGATTVINPGDRCVVNPAGHLIITV